MRGALLYEREDAAQNARFIELCMEAAAARRMEVSLAYADALPAALSEDLPDWALIRTRSAGQGAHWEAAGVRTFNKSALNALCNDKRSTYRALNQSVPMLPTVCLYPGDAPSPPPFLPCVVKPARGHGGEDVRLCRDEAAYHAALDACRMEAVVQPFADAGRDMRLYVIGGKVICAMLRENDRDFRSNYKLGGHAKPVTPGRGELEIAEAVCARYAPDYIGIDIIYDKGRPVLNELEDPVGARMVYENTDLQPAELLFAHIEQTLAQERKRETMVYEG